MSRVDANAGVGGHIFAVFGADGSSDSLGRIAGKVFLFGLFDEGKVDTLQGLFLREFRRVARFVTESHGCDACAGRGFPVLCGLSTASGDCLFGTGLFRGGKWRRSPASRR
jgi:hypothetical protein